ncbi:DUF1289 domain-containing protein [Marinibacterium profundimaris]|uniref:Fe-S oxidoreductase n=1 Tax=Marinibacterium profundimaris TaxID=1679460 RepID=A0A225NV47_9RHOB|nr:DUF1289 domain-containing protein [Marinibacterium profundimaris]OWU77218.1 hypothetical protein ATO3_00250 [Marinibacterium profundimaris]
MSDDVWKRQEVASPCVKICLVHPQEKICTGCYRTLDEIAQWSQMSPEAREKVIAELPSRAPRLRKRRGGRQARMSR